ncbi:MAG TPA: hypothetical protein VFQ53_02390 [Kofleriaceae bacterium]|nr:hypothetical protein [Kofleriaceae bacterium]
MPARDEDSGLHDIRNLASSARMRLSSKRISEHPPIDDDILASSSAGWKAVALPEPAKMVSLPSVDELPPPEVVKDQAKKASRRSKPQVAEGSEVAKLEALRTEVAAPTATASEAPVAPLFLEESAPIQAKDSASTPMIGARIAQTRQGSKSRKNVVFGVVGLGLAAAAGLTLYLKTGGNTAQPTAGEERAKAPASTVSSTNETRAAEPPKAPAATPEPSTGTAQIASDQGGAGADTAAAAFADENKVGGLASTEGAKADDKAEDSTRRGAAKPAKKVAKEKDAAPTTTVAAKTDKADSTKQVAKGAGGKDDEPDFDQLLKEAGVQDKKTETKPKLEKTSLSGGDFKAGMNAVRAKAQACYAGTQGTATVKLTIAPSGQVTKATVSGPFAGTPVASCVEAAVKSATFPPWDGGPQSFGYSYLLAE